MDLVHGRPLALDTIIRGVQAMMSDVPRRRRSSRSTVGPGDIALAAVLGAGVGAGLMYFLDPEVGSRRRASLRDQLLGMLRQTGEAVNDGSRGVVNRARGLVIELSERLQPGDIADHVLQRRVRSRVAAVVARPEAVAVEVSSGWVTLRGSVPTREVAPLLDRVSSVRGVKGVDNRLDVSPTWEVRSP